MTEIKMELNHYQILGVAVNVKLPELRKRYKKLCQKFHPDKDKTGANDEHFRRIRKAYDVLKDPERRALYDQGIKQGIRPEDFQITLKAMIQKVIIGTLTSLEQTSRSFIQTAKQVMDNEKNELKTQVDMFKKQHKRLNKYKKSIKKGKDTFLVRELDKKIMELEIGQSNLKVAHAVLEYLKENSEQIVCPDVEQQTNTLLRASTSTTWRP